MSLLIYSLIYREVESVRFWVFILLSWLIASLFFILNFTNKQTGKAQESLKNDDPEEVEKIKVPFKSVIQVNTSYLKLLSCFKLIENRQNWSSMVVKGTFDEERKKYSVRYFDLIKGQQ